MKIKPQTSILISIIIVAAGIFLTSTLSLWKTQSTKIPQKISQEQYSGQFSGQYNPADIRGSYTFSEVSNLFNVPLSDLAAAFSVKDDLAKDYKVKDLEAASSGSAKPIGTGSLRMFVAFYLGIPYDLSTDTWLPDTAGKILKEKAKLSQENLKYLESHTVSSKS